MRLDDLRRFSERAVLLQGVIERRQVSRSQYDSLDQQCLNLNEELKNIQRLVDSPLTWKDAYTNLFPSDFLCHLVVGERILEVPYSTLVQLEVEGERFDSYWVCSTFDALIPYVIWSGPAPEYVVAQSVNLASLPEVYLQLVRKERQILDAIMNLRSELGLSPREFREYVYLLNKLE